MKSRLVLALALLLTAIAPAAAAVTTKYTLSNASWTDLGAGPMLLGFSGAGVYAIADATPSIPKSEGFTMIAGESAPIATSSHVWAMAKDNPNVLAYVGPYDAPAGTSGGGGVVQQGAVDATGGVWVFDTGSTGNLINAVKGAIPAGSATIGATLAIGSAAINSNVIAVGTTSTLIAAARTGVPGTGRASITIVNTAQAVSLCVGNTGVTTANGMCLPAIAGASITLNTTAAVYGVWGDAGTHNVSFIETF